MIAPARPVRHMGFLPSSPSEIRKTVRKYLSKRAEGGPWALPSSLSLSPEIIVVIPVLAEEKRITATLNSLLRDSDETLARTLTLVVLNNPPADRTAPSLLAENRRTREALEKYRFGSPPRDLQKLYDSPINLSYVDATSPGLELPPAVAGVGMARKIGMDLALRLFPAETAGRRYLISLDGDTTVAPHTLSAVRSAFVKNKSGGLSLRFEHPLPDSRQHRRAVAAYEIYLRHWVLGLRRAGSPYGFHSIGSAMAVRADAYAASGGMNRRKTTEDFYFLQNLAKCAGVDAFDETCVYPSPRISCRVPVIGTGRSLERLLDRGLESFRLTDPKTFGLLAEWLRLLDESIETGPDRTIARARAIHPAIGDFLDSNRFNNVWSAIERNTSDPGTFIAQLHRWFDGLKTLRLIHQLGRRAFPLKPLVESALELLSDIECDPPANRRASPAGDSGGLLGLLARYRAADRAGSSINSGFEDCRTELYNGPNR